MYSKNKQHRKEVLCILEAAEKWFKFEIFALGLKMVLQGYLEEYHIDDIRPKYNSDKYKIHVTCHFFFPHCQFKIQPDCLPI